MKLRVCTMKRSLPLTACGNRGGDEIYAALATRLSNQNPTVEVEQIKCLGYCEEGPNVSAAGTGKLWSNVSSQSLEQIIEYCKHR